MNIRRQGLKPLLVSGFDMTKLVEQRQNLADPPKSQRELSKFYYLMRNKI
ncbi:hypothetical protein LL912_02135 [Niabella sp. CC-SYL272]|nr:hypothetical protein [Niabella agricola]MCF3107568.1 hypothetical protein [Niabella agricola]